MAIGESGRLVIEIDPDLKKQLYASFKQDGTQLKSWFLERAHTYIEQQAGQTSLFEKDAASKEVV